MVVCRYQWLWKFHFNVGEIENYRRVCYGTDTEVLNQSIDSQTQSKILMQVSIKTSLHISGFMWNNAEFAELRAIYKQR